MRRSLRLPRWPLIALFALCQNAPALAQSRSSEWEKVLEAAKKEGRVAVSIPTSAELRKEFETGFKKAFPGIELDLNVARGSSNIKGEQFLARLAAQEMLVGRNLR